MKLIEGTKKLFGNKIFRRAAIGVGVAAGIGLASKLLFSGDEEDELDMIEETDEDSTEETAEYEEE